MEHTPLATIGRNALVTISGIERVAGKVDTGADSSSIWATKIREQDGALHFTLFGPASVYYTGEEVVAENGTYEQVSVASSSGERQMRYKVTLPVSLRGKQLDVRFTLADRAAMTYPVLLGRNFLAGQFFVDVRKHIPDDIERSLIKRKDARTAH